MISTVLLAVRRENEKREVVLDNIGVCTFVLQG